MYLSSVRLRNTGPITSLDFNFPFEGENPKPVVLVGMNGSGKSTLISFIVNSLIGIKQRVYENSEVQQGKVFKVRSPSHVSNGSDFSFSKIVFNNKISFTEWQLTKSKKDFEKNGISKNIDSTWDIINNSENNLYHPNFCNFTPEQIKEFIDRSCFLFFPDNRFELPEWLNKKGLSDELKKSMSEPQIQGTTERRIISRNRLKSTLEWFYFLTFDYLMVQSKSKVNIDEKILFDSVVEILKIALFGGIPQNEKLTVTFSSRKTPFIGVTHLKNNEVVRKINNLTSISAGEAMLFSLFVSILQDADLSEGTFKGIDQTRGIVVIDEADLHLHLKLQYEALPKLIKLFPKIQFILSTHSPLTLLGLEKAFGEDGVEILELPSGFKTCAETYSEFQSAFNMLSETNRFKLYIEERLSLSTIPAILTEGKSDEIILNTAWKKLNPGKEIPFEVIPFETDGTKREGGAKILNQWMNLLPTFIKGVNRIVIGLFDNDCQGSAQFNGLFKNSLEIDINPDNTHKKLKSQQIHALLLPVPDSRKSFVHKTNIKYRYLSIEHYFSDDILTNYHLKNDCIAPDSNVFEINGSPKSKMKLAEDSKNFHVKEFQNFHILFDCLFQILSLQKSEEDQISSSPT